MKNHSGFTLIELLVVIAIIGMLSSVVISSLNSARVIARNSLRTQNLINLRTALEMYYADHGHYPKTFEYEDGSLVNFNKLGECQDLGSGESYPLVPPAYIPEVTPQYVAELPSDPSIDCNGITHSWFYASDGFNYKLITHPEDFDQNSPFSDPASWGHYSIQSPGAVDWGL